MKVGLKSRADGAGVAIFAFRIEKTRDYTLMSNHHLRDKSLSLKAKGLLSLMLSLAEEWDYTTKGLARICKDGVDSICAGVRELEEHGYVIRQRVRNPNGQLGAIEYTILEQPRPPVLASGDRDHILSGVFNQFLSEKSEACVKYCSQKGFL